VTMVVVFRMVVQAVVNNFTHNKSLKQDK